ncbi:MAG: patatin-like phospholipase family protein [candidate division Zixibacteria bacterium]|nr:patatin-like phospholipase family protein [candidate division Zixibacteria bacterium]
MKILPGKQEMKIALLLGGGGARGLAHIGVLRALENAAVPIAAIAGTSLGAIVAAEYSRMQNAAWCQKLFERFARSEAFKALGLDRVGKDMQRGQGFWNTILSGIRENVLIAIALRRQSIVPREKIDAVLSEFVADGELSELPIPVRIAASDLKTSRTVCFRSGSILGAARASTSLAGYFPPIREDGHLLVDGEATSILPIDCLAGLGITHTLAIDVSGTVWPDWEVTTALQALLRQQELERSYFRSYLHRLCDLVVHPELPGGFWTDFDRVEEFVEAGYNAMIAALPKLKNFRPRQPLAHLENPQPPPLYLEFPFSKTGALRESASRKQGEKAA